MLVIARQHFIQLLDHARRADPEECCGVLIGTTAGCARRVEHVLPATNVADDRTSTFEVDWTTLLCAATAAHRRASRIVGFYHSHPDGCTVPSRQDAAAAWADLCYVIVTGRDGALDSISSWTRSYGSRSFARQDVWIRKDEISGVR